MHIVYMYIDTRPVWTHTAGHTQDVACHVTAGAAWWAISEASDRNGYMQNFRQCLIGGRE